MLAPDGMVYLGADNGKLYAVAPPSAGEAGRLAWEFQTRGTLISSPIIGPDGSLYVGSMDGTVYAFHDAKRGKPTQGPLGGTWYGSVTLGGQEQRLTLVLGQRESQVNGVLRLQSTLAGGLRVPRSSWALAVASTRCSARQTPTSDAVRTSRSPWSVVKDCQGRSHQGAFRVTR